MVAASEGGCTLAASAEGCTPAAWAVACISAAWAAARVLRRPFREVRLLYMPDFRRGFQGSHSQDHNFHHFHHRFHRFAFVGAPFAYASYAAYDSCWRRAWTPYGLQWVNVCGDYGY